MERLACPRCGRARAPGLKECPACGDPAPVHARLRPARLERLLLSLAQALESGLSLQVLAGGPAVAERSPKVGANRIEGSRAKPVSGNRPGLAPGRMFGQALPAPLRDRLRSGVAAGEPLSSLLAGVLDAPALALLRAAEERGGVPAALRLVAARSAERRADRLKLLLSLAHPALLVLAAAVVLPLPLLFQGDVAGYAGRALPLAGAVIATTVAILLAGVVLPPGSSLDRALSWFALWFPPTRAVRLRSSLATFCTLLGEAIAAGLPVRAAAPLAAEAVDHPAVKEAGRAVPARLDAGETLTAALSSVPGLTPDALALLDAGERSGRLPESLGHVAKDARARARFLALLIHLALSTLVGVLVAGFVAYAIISAWAGRFEETRRLIEGIR